MEDNEIQRLFEHAGGNLGDESEELRRVFSILVSTTLEVRDHIREETGTILTVADVKTCLDLLIHFMSTGEYPDDINKYRMQLFHSWVDSLGLSQKG